MRPWGHALSEGVGGTAFTALAMAATRPVDIVGMGDSNQLQGGFGWDHGIGYAMRQLYAMYASPLFVHPNTTRENQGYLTANGLNGAADGTMPSGLDAFALPNANTPPSPLSRYQETVAIGNSNGIEIQVGGLNVNSDLRGYYCYGTFNSGSGSFRPAARLEESPYSTLVQGSVINTNTGAFGQAVTTLDVAAAVRDKKVSFKWELPGGTVSVAPTVEFWSRAEDRNASAGFAVNTLFSQAGASLYDMAEFVQSATDDALTNYFTGVRYIQVARGVEPVVVMHINAGLNDRNETRQPSLGPSPSSDPDSPEAFVDNLRAVTTRIEAIYALNGWALSGLYWLVTPSHRISDPDDAELLTFRAAARTWASGRARSSVVDFNDLMTAAEATTNSWYASGGADTSHLTQAGYEQLAVRELDVGL